LISLAVITAVMTSITPLAPEGKRILPEIDEGDGRAMRSPHLASGGT
jgi:hypothetical protein